MDMQKNIESFKTLEANLRQLSTAILSHYAKDADPQPHMIPSKLYVVANLIRETADSVDNCIYQMESYIEAAQ